MSNLITNGNFTSPSIYTNDFIYLDSFTPSDLLLLYWTITQYVSIQNNQTVFGYPLPSLIGFSQFASIQYNAIMKQLVNVSVTGIHILTFKYEIFITIY